MPRKGKGKAWGTGLSAAERKRKQRRSPLDVRQAPPSKREDLLKTQVTVGRIEDPELRRRLRDQAWKLYRSGNAYDNEAGFGRVFMLTEHQDTAALAKGAKRLLANVFEATLGLRLGTFAIEGHKVPSYGSPWILYNTKDSPLHNDTAGQADRSIPGRHFRFRTLFYAFEAPEKQPPTFYLYKETTTGAKEFTEIGRFPIEAGMYLSFPAKLAHEVQQAPRCSAGRLIMSVQYDDALPPTAEQDIGDRGRERESGHGKGKGKAPEAPLRPRTRSGKGACSSGEEEAAEDVSGAEAGPSVSVGGDGSSRKRKRE